MKKKTAMLIIAFNLGYWLGLFIRSLISII